MSSFKRIQIRRDTASGWLAANPILALGEGGLETDTRKLKYGDGVTAWNSLDYLTQGIKGDKGDKGDTGSTGLKGSAGLDGAAGATGATGLPGSKGDTGAKGDKGDTGATGQNGTNGAKGEKGDKGDTGLTGAAGTNGTNGTNGAKGDTGDTGDTGLTGATGAAGTNGTNGTDGADGTAATIAVGTVTTGAAGSSTIVTNSGTSAAAIFDITIPRGDTGAAGAGSGDVLSPVTNTDSYIPQWNGADSKTLKDGIPTSTFAAASHTHAESDVTNLTTDLGNKVDKVAGSRLITTAEGTVLGNTSGTNSGDNAANTTANTYADGKVADTITDAVTTVAPSQNAVFDALALKAPLTSPSFTTPTLGVAAATSINKVAITAPATSATLTIANGKTATVSRTITLTSTGDSAVMTFPNATDTVACLAAIQTITGAWSFNDGKLVLKGATSGTTTLKANATAGTTTATLPATTGTLVNATSVIDVIYPVGSIYISTVSTNPGTLFGVGTWAAYAAGRTLIGVGTSDQAFAAAATGGESTHLLTAAESGLPAHTHGIPINNGSIASLALVRGADNANYTTKQTDANTAASAASAHNNLPPYVVTYMWQRTA